MNIRQQQGFSLLEIVVVVVIIGFILGGMLRGQEMITSAKVRRVAGQLDEVRAAYLGFQDRFKHCRVTMQMPTPRWIAVLPCACMETAMAAFETTKRRPLAAKFMRICWCGRTCAIRAL